MRTILGELGLESPLVGTTVTAHVRSAGPDGFRCAVYDVATGRRRDALLPRADVRDLPAGIAPPEPAVGDTVVALVVDVGGGPADGPDDVRPLILSTTAPELVERVLSAFVNEILTGQVVITKVARVAGTKAKVAVAPTVAGVDARGACIGRGASRVKGAERLLNRGSGREKLEIIECSGDRAVFLANAMSPVQVSEVLIERGNAFVGVQEHQLSGGIGQGGLNAELAGRLTGLYVRVVKAGTDLRREMDRIVSEPPAAPAR